MKRRHCAEMLISGLTLCGDTFAMNSDSTAPGALIEISSPLAFAQTLDRITQAIAATGMLIFARLDHAAGAKAVGIAMPPTVVLVYGHPKGGAPIMLAKPEAALDLPLPLRVLVREDAEGRTWVVYRPVVPMLVGSGVPEAMARRLEPAQAILVQATRPS